MPPDLLQRRAFQASRCYLVLKERMKNVRACYIPTQFYSGSPGLQVAWILKEVGVYPDRIKRIRARQTEVTSALGPYDARHHYHRIRRCLEFGHLRVVPLEYLNVRSVEARGTLPRNKCQARMSGLL